MATQTPNQSENKEENDELPLGNRLESSVYSFLDKMKRLFDKEQDPNISIDLLNFTRATYNLIIYPLREDYSNNPSQREFYLAKADKVYEKMNGLYQYFLKRLEELGRPSSDLPKSLEKLTFPENK